MVRLGDGLFDSGELSPKAIKRTVKAILEFNEVIQEQEPDLLRAIATSALRTAPNPEKIIDPVFKETGVTIEVISGAEEARLIAAGVMSLLKLPEQRTALVDIGGGSTEISLIEQQSILFSQSLELGAGRNQQTYLKDVPPTGNGRAIRSLKTHIQKTLCNAIPEELHTAAPTIIGTSGSIRAFLRIANKRGLKGPEFSTEYLGEIIDILKDKTREEIIDTFPSLEPRRTDLILAAGIILEEICEFFDTESIRVTSCSLKDGVLANLTARYHL